VAGSVGSAEICSAEEGSSEEGSSEEGSAGADDSPGIASVLRGRGVPPAACFASAAAVPLVRGLAFAAADPAEAQLPLAAADPAEAGLPLAAADPPVAGLPLAAADPEPHRPQAAVGECQQRNRGRRSGQDASSTLESGKLGSWSQSKQRLFIILHFRC